MKSNPSPSAPLNLCPPTGVTGTTLPASIEGVARVPAKKSAMATCSYTGERRKLPLSEPLPLGWTWESVVAPSPAEPVKMPSSPVKDTPACQQTYFQSDVVAVVGDRIATGSMGDCRVLALTPDGYLRVENIFTKETAHVFASDCDLVDRPAPASPVDSVGVPAPTHTEGPFSAWGSDCIAKEGELIFQALRGSKHQLPIQSNRNFALAALNSHAAKDAKIKALEGALENLLEDTGIKDAIWLVEHKPGDEVDDEDARTIHAVEAARAALALPSA